MPEAVMLSEFLVTALRLLVALIEDAYVKGHVDEWTAAELAAEAAKVAKFGVKK
jgi:hypothetical protein